MNIKLFKLICLVFFSLNSFSFAQSISNEATAAKNEFLIWGGVSPDSNKLIGVTEDARFGIAAVRYARIFKPSRQIALKYTIDAVPVAVLSYPTLEIVSLGNNTFRIEQVRKNRYGWESRRSACR